MTPILDTQYCTMEVLNLHNEKQLIAAKILEVRLEDLKELQRKEHEFIAIALDKQAGEYERRLHELNTNLRMILEERKQFFTRDGHDAFVTEYRIFRDKILSDITVIQTRTITWTAAVSVGFTILTFILHFWK